jgi:hypothetical protein
MAVRFVQGVKLNCISACAFAIETFLVICSVFVCMKMLARDSEMAWVKRAVVHI